MGNDLTDEELEAIEKKLLQELNSIIAPDLIREISKISDDEEAFRLYLPGESNLEHGTLLFPKEKSDDDVREELLHLIPEDLWKEKELSILLLIALFFYWMIIWIWFS